MTRPLFLLTATAAALAAMAAILLRAEHTAPGVSWLFQGADGGSDGYLFNTVVNAHSKLAYIAVMGLGTAMLSAAHTKGALFARQLTWIGLLACVLAVVPFILSQIPFRAQDPVGTGVGWVLYPPLSTPTLLDRMALALGFDAFWITFPQFYMLGAAFLLLSGAYAMISTLPRLRLLGALGPFLMALVTAAAVVQMVSGQPLPVLNSYVMIVALLLACAAFGLRGPRQTWLIILCVGIAAPLAAQLALMNTIATPRYTGTITHAAMPYIFPLGIAWLAGPAAILFYCGVDLPIKSMLFVTIAPLVGLAAWIIPLLLLGRAGMGRGYGDYPDVFGTMNGVATIGVALFAALYLAALRTAIKAR